MSPKSSACVNRGSQAGCSGRGLAQNDDLGHSEDGQPTYPQTILITSILTDYQQARLAHLLANGRSLDDIWRDLFFLALPEHSRFAIETELTKVEAGS